MRNAGSYRTAALVLAGLFLSPALSRAEEAGTLKDTAPLQIAGSVEHPGSYDLARLQAMPTSTESVLFSTGHGPVSITVKGVTIWEILKAAGLATDPKDRDPSLRKILVASGADGYKVGVALAEIDPKFGGSQAMVAFEQDGKPLSGEFRLIVPGDKAGGRDVHHLVRLEIQDLK